MPYRDPDPRQARLAAGAGDAPRPGAQEIAERAGRLGVRWTSA